MLRPSIFKPKTFDLVNYFNDFENDFFHGANNLFNGFHTDVIDKGDSYKLQAELPGFNKEDIHIDINGDYLTISAEHKEEVKENKENFIRQERYYGSFQRSFNISNVNTNEIDASYQDGILEIKLPKLTEQIPSERRIEIK